MRVRVHNLAADWIDAAGYHRAAAADYTADGLNHPVSIPLDSSLAPRLRPFDGLFLRAPHLDAISEFAVQRQQAVARATGSGVISGLEVALEGDDLMVACGEAIAEGGRVLALRHDERVAIPWDALDTSDVYAVVLQGDVASLEPDTRTDFAYSVICDPCSTDTRISTITSPYIADQCRIGFVPLRLELRSGDGGKSEAIERTRVASAWFQREGDRYHQLVPTSLLEPPKTLAQSKQWTEATNATSDQEWLISPHQVPLALLWESPERKGTRYIDQWAARRELTEMRARSVAEQRFGMRPLSVFLAQIQQFQSLAIADFEEFVCLPSLPPAGYLRRDVSDGLGDSRLVVHRCPIDRISAFVLEAQHLDRITLDSAEDRTSLIEFFVPTDNAGTEIADFVAFRRRSGCQREVERSEVGDKAEAPGKAAHNTGRSPQPKSAERQTPES